MGAKRSYWDSALYQTCNSIPNPEASPSVGNNNGQMYQPRNSVAFAHRNQSSFRHNSSLTLNGMSHDDWGQQTLGVLPRSFQFRNAAFQDQDKVRTLGFGTGNFGGNQSFFQDDLQYASAGSFRGVSQPLHGGFGNIQNPHSTFFPSNVYGNMELYNPSNMPRVNYGPPPHFEVDNGMQPLPGVYVLPPADSFIPSPQPNLSGSQQSHHGNALLNQQLYSPPESVAKEMNVIGRAHRYDFGSNHCHTMFSPSKRLKAGSFLPIHSSSKLPPLQQWPSSCLSPDSSNWLQTSVDPSFAMSPLQSTASGLPTSREQNPLSSLLDNVLSHNLGDKGYGEPCNNIRGSIEKKENSPSHVVEKVHSFEELFSGRCADRAIGESDSVKSNSEKRSLVPGLPPEISDMILPNADSPFPEKVGCQEEMKNEDNQVNIECMKPEKGLSPASDCRTLIKTNTKKLERRGFSLFECFTAEQIKEHVMGLSRCASQNQSRERNGDKEMAAHKDDLCLLCGENTILFSPPPMYCSSCSGHIKARAIYYTSEEVEGANHLLCSSCHKNLRGDITLSGTKILKTSLFKRKNDSDTEEKWVQCDKCNGWLHQICGLYNEKVDLEGKAQYICPNCLLREQHSIYTDFQTGTRFGAKDLPCTILSNYIEQRLFRRLRQEREETAKAAEKSIDDVPGPEDLVVRVVLSVDQQLKVNHHFADIFHNEEYPVEFPFRSKAILLFQKIEGVDVCIFGLYAQEFGSECSQPDQRCIYISYLDSVKYFRPDRETSKGEPLRTFVYHEILIAYLEYSKRRGFATCYLWACPPTKGEDYIMYCHPETQKTPKPDKLRQWYLSMLKKASEERVVLNVTNLYERFFVLMEKFVCKITAARLPYFDGAYWSRAAENFVQDLESGGKDEVQKRMKLVTTRKLKAFGYKSPPESAAKDILVMQKLGETILPVKEDLLVVQLHHSCIRCSQAILSGWRWFCEKCKNFQLCERCHDAEQKTSGEETHIANLKEMHLLSKVMVNGISSSTTEDNDIILENDLFGDRHGFLEFCQKNHYQFDTLRRAKHSSMMILYHLHSTREQTSERSSCTRVFCTLCDSDITAELHHPCLICSDYRVCMRCYNQRNTKRAIHLFAGRPSAHGERAADADQKIASVTKLLNTLKHATDCRTDPCPYPKCRSIKNLFGHATMCEVRAPDACGLSKKMWNILELHSNHCEERDCRVPHCRNVNTDCRNIQKQ